MIFSSQGKALLRERTSKAPDHAIHCDSTSLRWALTSANLVCGPLSVKKHEQVASSSQKPRPEQILINDLHTPKTSVSLPLMGTICVWLCQASMREHEDTNTDFAHTQARLQEDTTRMRTAMYESHNLRSQKPQLTITKATTYDHESHNLRSHKKAQSIQLARTQDRT